MSGTEAVTICLPNVVLCYKAVYIVPLFSAKMFYLFMLSGKIIQ